MIIRKVKNTDIPEVIVNKKKIKSYLRRLYNVSKNVKLLKTTNIRINIMEDSTLFINDLRPISFKEIVRRNDFFYDYMFKHRELETYFLTKFYNIKFKDKFFVDYGLNYLNYWNHYDNLIVWSPNALNELYIYKETYINVLKYNIFLDKTRQNLSIFIKNTNDIFILNKTDPLHSIKFKYFLAGYFDVLGNFNFRFIIDKRVNLGIYFDFDFIVKFSLNLLPFMEKAIKLFSDTRYRPEIMDLEDYYLVMHRGLWSFKKSKIATKRVVFLKKRQYNFNRIKKYIYKKKKKQSFNFINLNQPKNTFLKYTDRAFRHKRVSLFLFNFMFKKKKKKHIFINLVEKEKNFNFFFRKKLNKRVKDINLERKIRRGKSFKINLQYDKKKYIYRLKHISLIYLKLIPFFKEFILPFSLNFLNFNSIEFIFYSIFKMHILDIVFFYKLMEVVFCDSLYTGTYTFIFLLDVLIQNSSET